MKSIYRTIFITLIAILSINPVALAQWSADFSSSGLEDWTGDTDNFIINDDAQLQLNAPDAGEVTIFRSSEIMADTISIGMYHLLDFAPSDNNKSTIYLALDNTDLAIANGYYLTVGENGSDDAIKFYYLENGTSQLISTATMGAMAAEPADVSLMIDVYPDGLWSIKTDYESLGALSLDVEFIEERFSFKDSKFFGISCKFSASRADKFFYDDMYLRPFEVDRTSPVIVNASATNSKEIIITFDEPVEPSDALDVTNYQVNNGIGSPSIITSANNLNNEYILLFEDEFESAILYTLTVSNIRDLNDNVMEGFTFDFNVPSTPIFGDILLTEILFDPYLNGEDFVEMYNTSDKFLDLRGVTISNTQNDASSIISAPIVLAPKSYLALSEDVDFLIQEYKPDPEASLATSDLPAFNNDSGNVSLITTDGTVLDSFDYTDDLHFSLIDDTEGVSLERVSFDIETNSDRNWQSASQNARFATPGYKNSNEINVGTGEEMFEVMTETFSPNQDGDSDVMILNYNLDKSGFVANIAVYDAAGYKINDLSQNELLSTQGIIIWDGTDAEGNISNLGIYLVVGKIFHPDGDLFNFKKTTVLADFID